MTLPDSVIAAGMTVMWRQGHLPAEQYAEAIFLEMAKALVDHDREVSGKRYWNGMEIAQTKEVRTILL